jgi:hypothetical protein
MRRSKTYSTRRSNFMAGSAGTSGLSSSNTQISLPSRPGSRFVVFQSISRTISHISIMTKILPEALRSRSSVFTLFDNAIIVTTNGIYSWTSDGIKELFRSGSGGIVAARQIHGPQNLLAVADSQVVILHDIDKGQQKSYRLKRTDVSVANGPSHYM